MAHALHMIVVAQGQRSCCCMAEAACARSGMKRAMSDASKTTSQSSLLTCVAMARVTYQLTRQTTPSQEDQGFLRHFDASVMLGWVRAMLDWPAIEPADFRCPTLWLIGSEDRHAMASLKEYEESLKGSRVQVQIVEGLDHNQVFDEIDRVFPTMLAFAKS